MPAKQVQADPSAGESGLSKRLVVALDGPASSGKSSVGAAAAAILGYRFCDTGLLYRAVTWLAIRHGVGEDDPAGLVGLVDQVQLIEDGVGRLAHVTVDGVDVTTDVHSPEVDAHVSGVSRVAELRAVLLARQRAIVDGGGIVMAGRDIGTVVLPDADLKIFLDASAEVRARRRAIERGLPPEGPEAAEILSSLRARDAIDRSRAVAPLRPADDARIIATDGNSFERTVELVAAEIRRAEANRSGALADPRVVSPTTPSRDAPRRRRTVRTRIDSRLTLFVRLASLLARVVSRAFAKVRVEGDFSRIPRTGPLIVVSNHLSNADPVVLGGFLTPRLGRRQNWLGKRELFDWPVIGWGAENLGIHPLDRSIADVEAFKIAKRILDEGHVLTVFPEGTRSPDGVLREAKDGVAVLAFRSGAPIVPVAIVGTDRVWPKGGLPRPGGRIVIRVGAPFSLVEDGGSPGAGAPDAGPASDVAPTTGQGSRRTRHRAESALATLRLMGKIAELLPPSQRGIYAGQAGVAMAEAGARPAPGTESGVAPER